MSDVTSKEEMLRMIHSERNELDRLLEQVGDHNYEVAGIEADWTIKDILAHITAWEQKMIHWVEVTLRGEIPDRPAPGMTWDDLDKVNSHIYHENKEKPLDAVLGVFKRSYQKALEVAEGLSEGDLFEPNQFPWRDGDPLWHMIAANTWWHYKDHREAIQAWLQG